MLFSKAWPQTHTAFQSEFAGRCLPVLRRPEYAAVFPPADRDDGSRRRGNRSGVWFSGYTPVGKGQGFSRFASASNPGSQSGNARRGEFRRRADCFVVNSLPGANRKCSVRPRRGCDLGFWDAVNEAACKRLAQVGADGKSFRTLFPALQAHRHKNFRSGF